MLGLLGRGRDLVDHLGGELIAVHSEINCLTTQDIVDFGGDAIYELGHSLPSMCHPEPLVNAISKLALEKRPYAILFGASRLCKEIAPRVATRLRTGYAADCAEVAVAEDTRLVFKRYVYGGNAVATLTLMTNPQIATISSKALLEPQKRHGARGRIIKIETSTAERASRILAQEEVTASPTLEEAEVVVCVGRGFRRREDLSLAEELASVLGGEVGCTRPIAEDLKWYPKERHIGLSGVVVSPGLYITAGVSGAIQHQMGMRDSKMIVAINNNPEAPIFEIADYGVVGDLYHILPALINALKQR
jgi:electron transfer flavoprotein alpha subunit